MFLGNIESKKTDTEMHIKNHWCKKMLKQERNYYNYFVPQKSIKTQLVKNLEFTDFNTLSNLNQPGLSLNCRHYNFFTHLI